MDRYACARLIAYDEEDDNAGLSSDDVVSDDEAVSVAPLFGLASTGIADRQLAKRIAIPRSKLKMVPHAGHLSTMEQPAEVTAAIEGFLAERK